MDQLFTYEFFGNDLFSWMKAAFLLSLSILLSVVIRKTMVARTETLVNSHSDYL